MNPKFKNIVNLFRKLPGVGPRQAGRFVLSLMGRSDAELREFGNAISNLHEEIRFCPECFNLSENHQCAVCLDPKRDRAKLLVVEKINDLESIEKTGIYAGLYHVLGGSINPIDGITPETLRLKELNHRVNKFLRDRGNENSEIEIIIATNPNTAGETTSLFIHDMFQNKNGVTITRLARGLATGSYLEYADEITLKHALEYRK